MGFTMCECLYEVCVGLVMYGCVFVFVCVCGGFVCVGVCVYVWGL